MESIVIHTDIKEKLNLLSDAEAGQLFKAIIAYAEDGTILIKGVDEGTYTLTEKSTLEGFNLLTAPVTVTVSNTGAVTISNAINAMAMQTNAMAMQLHQKKCKLMQPKPYLIVFL